jgi:hypothetical protein
MLREWANYQEAKSLSHDVQRRRMTDLEVASLFQEAYNPVAELLKQSNPYRFYLLKMNVAWARREVSKAGMDPREVTKWL